MNPAPAADQPADDLGPRSAVQPGIYPAAQAQPSTGLFGAAQATAGPSPTPVRAGAGEECPDLVSSSDQYALRFSGPAGRLMLDRQSLALRRLVAHTGGQRLRVLDVGGGHMQVSPLLSALGHSVVVHGTSAEALRKVSAHMNGSSAPLETRQGPLVPLPAEDAEFDLVVSLRMIGHFTRWHELLAEQCRVARRWVIVEFACTGGFQRLSGALFGLKRLLEGDTRRYSTFAIADVTRALSHHAFRVVSVERQFVLPLVVHRVLQHPGFTGGVESMLERAGLARRVGNPVLVLAERIDSRSSSSAREMRLTRA